MARLLGYGLRALAIRGGAVLTEKQLNEGWEKCSAGMARTRYAQGYAVKHSAWGKYLFKGILYDFNHIRAGHGEHTHVALAMAPAEDMNWRVKKPAC